jgi:dihydropyrimidine dehydrogenase (NAD+) subunit PreT
VSDSNNVGVKAGISLKPTQGYLEETVPPFTPFLAMEEAARCLLCYNPPCSEGCPADTNPGDFIRAIRFRNFKGAAEIIRSNNILGGVCARVCPYEKTCEGACERSGIDKPIQIGRLQRFVTDYEKSTNFQVLDPPKATKEKVAMIGSGPASLSAAATLAMKGYPVTIFEEKEKAGGVLSYGIVPARLPQYVVDEEIEYVTKLGVEIKLNTKVGKDISLDEIRKQDYKAIMIGAGMQITRTLPIPGKELEGVTTAVEYLAKARSNDASFNAGKHVVVIGGGDVALDCATTARLNDAESVTVLYRRTREEAPANRQELEYTESLGINFAFTLSPSIFESENGKLTTVKANGTRSKSAMKIEADTVVFAIGQQPEDFSKVIEGIGFDKNNFITSLENGTTSVPDIFVAGDIDIDSTKTVVNSVQGGKIAAISIEEYLTKAGRKQAFCSPMHPEGGK